jgi:carbamoyl-phosphate synthase, small subunit
MKAKLILENGAIFQGTPFGCLQDSVGEVVFNTGMTGYQEVITDPSYYGQIVTMTYPLIGNYGINLDDMESKFPKVKGFIVREKCNVSSNFRDELELDDYLRQNGVLGLEGIDTRALTKILRNSGTMNGVITLSDLSYEDVKSKLQAFSNTDAVERVTTREMYTIEGEGKHIAILDFGIKQNIIRSFMKRKCRITVFPASTGYKDILNADPDLIFLSNGPGDPEDLKDVIENIKKLIGIKPMVGICLGHQLLALALGGRTAKLKFGHRGCNHPVKDIESSKVYITSQNHGYYVNVLPNDVEATHINVNDGTIEGMKHKRFPIFSIQFHPEACPGPLENQYIFDTFMKYAL